MEIEFKDIPERENFRKALYREKSNQDKAVAAILDEDKSKTLFFKQRMEGNIPFATCWIGERERHITFKVLPTE